MGMETCCTLGLLNAEQAKQLKEAGLTAPWCSEIAGVGAGLRSSRILLGSTVARWGFGLAWWCKVTQKAGQMHLEDEWINGKIT